MNAYEKYAKLLAEVETLESQVADMAWEATKKDIPKVTKGHIYNVKFESMHIQDTCNKIISIANED
jgi:hypothetical protein